MMDLSLTSPSKENPMSTRPIKQVRVEYEDGTHDTFLLQEGVSAGYHRKSYTYEAKPDGSSGSKWGARIDTHEIFWTERKEGKQ